jgi:glycosyltransferase involved in cell wall biosynthesis
MASSATHNTHGGGLTARVVMAMPMGPPYGGMTSNARLLRQSSIFANEHAVLVDTTPPSGEYSRPRRAAHSLRLAKELVTTLRRHRAEVAFFSSSSFAGFYEKAALALLCKGLGARTVIHLVGSFIDFHQAASAIEKQAISLLLSRFDRVLVVSREFLEYFGHEIPAAHTDILANPVDCAEFQSRAGERRKDGRLQILFAGAIVEGKGILDLLAAAELARSDLADVAITCIGDGPLLDTCRRFVEQRQLGSLVQLPGFVDQATKQRMFRESEIFVLPSHFEAMPISVLEASATGIAVVATDVGAMRSAVLDDVSGLIVPARNPPRLAEALVRLVRDEGLRRSMGDRGASWVRAQFDAPIVAGRLIETFNTLAAERRR